MAERIHTFCRVCEPACGLVATVEGEQLVQLEPDRTHPVSKGFACPRGIAGVEINHDPDRVNFPVQQVGGERRRRTWNEAIADVAARLRAVVDTHGPEAVALYVGNPASFNALLGPGVPDLFRRLGVTRKFGAGTQDCANKYAASSAVFGTTMLHPLPDVDHAEVILLIGSNWRASKGSFISTANPWGQLVAARKRGARIWFVNPRDSESAGERTGPTLQIKPDTDVYLLAAMLAEIDRTVGFHGDAEAHGSHLDELRAFVHRFPPERVAPICGVPAAAIEEVAQAFATAPRAAVHLSTGVNMGRQGTLAYWLMHMLSLVTGNLDRAGGNVPAGSVYPIVAKTKADYGRGFTTDGDFGEMRRGDLPGGLLADYITSAADPVRALVVLAGNPLLSVPGEERLREALARLDLLVTVDIYPSATSDLADWVLPATDQFERPDVTFVGLGLQPQPYVQATPAVVAPQFERREEWWILARLARALGLPSLLDEDDPAEAAWGKLDHMLAAGGVTRAALAASPQGILTSDGLVPGRLHDELVLTADGKVDCCPAGFADALTRCDGLFVELAAEPADQLKLISRRDSRMHNSWFANVEGMKGRDRTTNRLAMHPDDAARLAIGDRSTVTVRSASGELQAEADLDGGLRPGVVSLEHGWGLQAGLRLSRERPGVNVNRLTPSGPGSFDPSSNQQQLTGIPVTVSPVR